MRAEPAERPYRRHFRVVRPGHVALGNLLPSVDTLSGAQSRPGPMSGRVVACRFVHVRNEIVREFVRRVLRAVSRWLCGDWKVHREGPLARPLGWRPARGTPIASQGLSGVEMTAATSVQGEGWPDFLTVEQAAAIVRIGRTKAYELARRYVATDGSTGCRRSGSASSSASRAPGSSIGTAALSPRPLPLRRDRPSLRLPRRQRGRVVRRVCRSRRCRSAPEARTMTTTWDPRNLIGGRQVPAGRL